MRKKKNILLSPIAVLSLLLIILISLIFLISPKSPKSLTLPNSSSSPPKFSFQDILSARGKKEKTTTLIAVGDIMLGRFVNIKMLQKNDWRYPFLKIAGITSTADLTFGNLESPFAENCPSELEGMIFCARPEAVEGLKFAGFDILSLANNHILNYGQKGLEQTQKLLSSSNILYSPFSSSSVPGNETMATMKQVTGLSFGFLSFDLTQTLTNLSDRGFLSMAKFVEDESKKVDILIVSLHWGNEYQKQPTKSQVDLAHQIINAGAKIILGHHPHVTQPVEKYKDGLIFYSLGNFIFDQPWSEETKKGEIAKIIFEGKEIKSYEIIPIYTENFCQPRLVN